MIKQIPDKWIRKAITDVLHNMTVLDEENNENINVPCYDTRVPTNNTKNHYILLTTQTNTVVKGNKCEYSYESSILLDIITSFYSSGNGTSRLLAENILDKARELTNDLQLDNASGLTILRRTQNFPNDISTITPTESVFRKLMRIELFVN